MENRLAFLLSAIIAGSGPFWFRGHGGVDRRSQDDRAGLEVRARGPVDPRGGCAPLTYQLVPQTEAAVPPAVR